MIQVCRLVGFCGPEHAQLHRPEQFCFPFMVEMREGVGRLVLIIRMKLELSFWIKFRGKSKILV